MEIEGRAGEVTEKGQGKGEVAVYTTDGGNITLPIADSGMGHDGIRADISAMAISIGAMTKAIGQLAHSTAGAVEENRSSSKASTEALTEAVKGDHDAQGQEYQGEPDHRPLR